MSFAVGESVGPYQITAQLGSGGMAMVYKAYHATLDRYVAIKVMHQALKESPNFFARFQREARIVARLEHPNIVPVYDFSEHAGQPYLVMRFVEGETLKAYLQTNSLTLPQVMDIVRPVCQALTYAHRQGVLHRDIKPSNILITPQGDVFLTDFGLAKIAQAGESTLTQDMLVGTPHYISPEQAQSRTDLDARTDIYSLGVVLYELLVGRVPFQGDTPYVVIHDHIFTPLPMPRDLNPALPEPFERVLLKVLAKERDDRYASAAELLATMERAVAESGPSAPVVAAPAGAPGEQATVAAAGVTRVVPVPPVPRPAPPAAPAESRQLLTLNCAQCGASPLTDNGDGTVSCPYCGSVFAHPERVCPRCEMVNEADAARCISCGEKLREPCVRCGTFNWVQASHCQNCGAALDMLEHIAARHAETTAERLRRFGSEMPAIKDEAERASQERLEKMWTQERARMEKLAKAKAEQQRQERLIWTIAAVAIAMVVIAIVALAVVAQLR